MKVLIKDRIKNFKNQLIENVFKIDIKQDINKMFYLEIRSKNLFSSYNLEFYDFEIFN